MISTFLQAVKNSGKLSMAVSIAFFLGMLVSAYLLFTLPHNLIIDGGLALPALERAWPVLITLFVSVGLTFILGIAAINVTLQSRRQIVVYLEKKKEDGTASVSGEENAAGGLTDLSSFKALLQQSKGEKEMVQNGLNDICQQLQAGQGAVYQILNTGGKKSVVLRYGFALTVGESTAPHFEFGEGLIGQAAAHGKSLYIDEVPEGYITIISGLGTASPRYLFIVPMKKGEEVIGVLEMATFTPLHDVQRSRVEDLVKVLAEKIN